MVGRAKPRSQAKPNSRSNSVPAKVDTSDGQQLCGTCSVDVGMSPIGCDECETWVHGTEMCSGLPKDVLDAILKYDGHGIKFSCMKCRLKPQSKANSSSGADKEIRGTLQQLFQQFCGMCTVLTELSSQVKAFTQDNCRTLQADASIPQHPAAAPIPSPPPAPDRALIREELKEMREREKRRQSIIIRGLTANGPREAASKFDQLTETQFGIKVDLAEITRIPGHGMMFRAKIMSDEQRKLVLDNAKKLKDSTYSSVYISRDLTRVQRTELYEKRKARQSSGGTVSSVTEANRAASIQHVPSAPPLSQEN